MTSESSEISIGPIKLKGSVAKQFMPFMGWLVAVGMGVYSMYGPPATINTKLTELQVKIEQRDREDDRWKLKVQQAFRQLSKGKSDYIFLSELPRHLKGDE
jgi:hypothetical protein